MLCQLSYCPSAPPATVIRRPQRLSEGARKQWWFATKRSSVLRKLARVEPSPSQMLFDGGEQHAGRQAVDRRRDVVRRWKGGRDPDVAVPRVLAVRERGPCACHRDPRLLGQRNDSGGGVVGDIEADEVAAVGIGPARRRKIAQPLFEDR